MESGMLAAALTAATANTVMLALAHLYLAAKERDRVLWNFFAAWTVYGLRFVASIINESYPHPGLVVITQISVVVSSFALLYAFELWLGNVSFRKWTAAFPVGISAWVVWAASSNASFVALSFPVFVYSGGIFLWSGTRLLLARKNRVPANVIVGAALIVWGLHKFDYPFLRTVAWFAPWGFLLGALAATIVGVGTVLIYFERTGDRLTQALHDREVLVREVHHRVKNNLAIIYALLGFQKDRFADEELQNAFATVQDRVTSIALVHEELLQSGRLEAVRMLPYITTLLDRLAESLDTHLVAVTIERQVEDLELEMDKAVPCGLILAELVSNCYEHAFSEASSGSIRVELSSEPDASICLRVRDNGSGMSPGGTTGTGVSLIEALADQIGGVLTIQQEHGTTVSIRFGRTPPSRSAVAAHG